MLAYCVYVHISPSNKCYVGITSRNPESRWGFGGANYKYNAYFYRAIKKYGWDNFKHIVLFSNLSKEMACIVEIELIRKYQLTNPEFGYNIMLGGDLGNTGRVFSKSVRLKVSNALKGRKLSDESKKHISESLKGRVITDVHRKHLSEALKGKYVKELSPIYGKKRTLENCKHISDGLKGHEVSDNVLSKSVPAMHSECANLKRKQSLLNRDIKGENNPFYGKHHTPDTKVKIGLRTKDCVWVNNKQLHKNKQIKEDELSYYLSIGYEKGFVKWKLMDI